VPRAGAKGHRPRFPAGVAGLPLARRDAACHEALSWMGHRQAPASAPRAGDAQQDGKPTHGRSTLSLGSRHPAWSSGSVPLPVFLRHARAALPGLRCCGRQTVLHRDMAPHPRLLTNGSGGMVPAPTVVLHQQASGGGSVQTHMHCTAIPGCRVIARDSQPSISTIRRTGRRWRPDPGQNACRGDRWCYATGQKGHRHATSLPPTWWAPWRSAWRSPQSILARADEVIATVFVLSSALHDARPGTAEGGLW
jgi:hypothetical protein